MEPAVRAIAPDENPLSQSVAWSARARRERVSPDFQWPSATDPDRASNSKLRYEARVFKASRLLESKLTDAYLVCFETGGLCDCNDAIFLLANVSPWKIPEPWQKEEKRWTLKELQKGLGIPENKADTAAPF